MSFVTKMTFWNTRCLHALASQVEKADERLTDLHREGCTAASPHNHPCPSTARTLRSLGPPLQGTSAGQSHSPQETLWLQLSPALGGRRCFVDCMGNQNCEHTVLCLHPAERQFHLRILLQSVFLLMTEKISTIKDTNINRPSVGLPAWSFTSPPAHRRNITVVTELLFCSSNDRVTGNTSTTEECSVTQQHFWFIPVCSPEKAKKQLRTALLLACNKCNISAVSWCLNEIPVGHGTLPQGCKVSDEEAHLAFCAQLSGRLLLYSVMQMVWMARHR